MRRLVVSALLTVATTAQAAPLCECDPTWTFPSSTPVEGQDAGPGGTMYVPLNVQVFVSWPGTTPGIIDFHEMNAGPVAFTGEPAGDLLGQLWLRPNGPLQPSTTYVVANGVDQLTFTTGTAMDTTPPAVDHVTAQGARMEGACPDHLGAEVRASAADQMPLTEPTIYQVQLDRYGPMPDDYRRTLFVPDTNPFIGLVTDPKPKYANCLHNYDLALASWDYKATVTVYDQAGNATTNELTADFRFANNPTNAGCQAAPGASRGGAAALLLVGAALLLTSRRRRS